MAFNPIEMEIIVAAGTNLGGEIHIQDVDTLLYPIIGREVIDKDISPTKLASKRSKTNLKFWQKSRDTPKKLY